MTSRAHATARWLAVPTLALLLAGCVRVDMELEVSADDTVSGSAVLAVDDGLLELTGQTAEELFRGMETTADLPAGASTEPYQEDGFVGQRISFDDVPLSEFSRGGLAETGEELSITRRGDEFHVNGQLDMTSSRFGGGEVPPQLLDSVEFRIAITFPGPVRSASGEVDGNTVTWMPRVGENTRIRAVASAIPSGPPWMLILLIVAGAVVIGAVVLLLVSRRRAPAPAAGEGSGWPEPAAGPIGQPPPVGTPVGEPPASTTEAPEEEPPPPSPDLPSQEPSGPPARTPAEPSSTASTPSEDEGEDAADPPPVPPVSG